MRRFAMFWTLAGAVVVAMLAATTAGAGAASAGGVGGGVASISAPVLVTVNGGGGYADRPRNETTIAVDPADPRVVIGGANDYIVGDSSCGTYISRDGGATWTDSILPGHAYRVGATLPLPGAPAVGTTPQEHSRLDLSGDPGIAFDARGDAFYICLGANRPENDGTIYVSTAPHGTLSFDPPVLVDSGITPIVFNDKPSIAVDATTGKATSGNVYVFYTKFFGLTATVILESRSTDHGRTFSTPQIISTLNQATASGTSAGVGPNGEVYVAYENDTMNPCAYQACQSTQASEIDVQASTDGGVTWSSPRKAVDDVPGQGSIQHTVGRDNSFPTLVVDNGSGPYAGRVYMAWTDYRDGHADVRFTSSSNGGTTWTPPRKLNDDNPDRPGADHVFPGLAVAPDGLLAADWPVDQRDDPTNGHFRAYYTESRDGGVTFSRNVPLSPSLYNGNDADFRGAFIGDYNGLTADDTAVHPLWVGMREDDPHNPDATRHEVLYTNAMPRTVTSTGRQTRTLPVVGGLVGTPSTSALAAPLLIAWAALAPLAGVWGLLRRRRRAAGASSR